MSLWNFRKRRHDSPVRAEGDDVRPREIPISGITRFDWMREYTATVRIRQGPGRHLPPEADQLQGETLLFLASSEITSEEDPAYAGETKMVVWDEGPSPVDWLPSGDLTDIQPVEKPEPRLQPDVGIRMLLHKEAQHEADKIARQQRFIRRVKGEE